MNTPPFITWNIDEVAAEIVATAAKRFQPDNHTQQSKRATLQIMEYFEDYSKMAFLCTTAEVLADAEEQRTIHIEEFRETGICLNWFGAKTQTDELFFFSALILFYNRLISEGFAPISTAPATERPPVATVEPEYKTFADLFVNPADIGLYVGILNKYEAGKSKGGGFKKFVLVAWIDSLHSINKIHTSKPELVAPVLANELKEVVARRTFYETAKGTSHAKGYFIMHFPH